MDLDPGLKLAIHAIGQWWTLIAVAVLVYAFVERRLEESRIDDVLLPITFSIVGTWFVSGIALALLIPAIPLIDQGLEFLNIMATIGGSMLTLAVWERLQPGKKLRQKPKRPSDIGDFT